MKVFVAGHTGMVGSAVATQLISSGHEVLSVDHAELDLTRQALVESYLNDHNCDAVVVAAAKVGGIHANNAYPANFIYDNLMIEANLIHASHMAGVKRLIFLGSSCIYPRLADQPISEHALLTGPLEPTNEAYAIAKIAGIKLCESYNRQYGSDFRSLMPTNLYGPGDNFHPVNSHVIPALIQRFHHAVISGASRVEVWGTGQARREFLHVFDLARAVQMLVEMPREVLEPVVQPMQSHLNVGTGVDISIKELTQKIAQVAGFDGEISYDHSKPDGTPRKLLDVSKINALGWQSAIDLKAGLRQTYEWYSTNLNREN